MYDWLGLEHLYATGRPIIEDDIDRLYEMPACTRIQERQRKFFRIPPSWPVKSVTVPCASIDPDTGFEDHFCIKGEPNIIRHGHGDFTASDRRIANAPTSLLIDRQRFRCRTCGKVWSEAMPDIREEHEMTRRLHRDLAIASTEDPFQKVAARYGVHEKMVRTIFHEYSAAMLEGFQFDLPEVLGLDDTRLLGHPRLVCTDVREGKILDIFGFFVIRG
ncbi:helix-turn-helix domain-containing protein [Methylobacterium sp. NPDC080182]|uniref:helix-turn-helix domain-containing protein n=1 Tax=Methylobacterium sp. NPDC080182 TaxID=3390590 RepID=UPI003D056F20